jgi:osmoprotectant transport system permease protein
VLDGLVRLVEASLDRRRRGRLVAGLAGFALVAAASVAPLVGLRPAAAGPRVTIGAKTFTEQYILAGVLAGVARREAGADAQTLESLGSTVAFDALQAGRIDAYVDYSGTLWTSVLGRSAPLPDRAAVLAEMKRALRDERGVEVLASLGLENTYAFAMRRADADRLGVRTLTDLAARAP